MISRESLGQSYWIQESGRHERNDTKPWVSQYIEAMTMRTMSHRFNPSPFSSYHALRRRNRIQPRLRGTFKTCTLEDRQLIRSAFTLVGVYQDIGTDSLASETHTCWLDPRQQILPTSYSPSRVTKQIQRTYSNFNLNPAISMYYKRTSQTCHLYE